MSAMVTIDQPNKLFLGHSSKTSITNKENGEHRSQIQKKEIIKYVEISTEKYFQRAKNKSIYFRKYPQISFFLNIAYTNYHMSTLR